MSDIRFAEIEAGRAPQPGENLQLVRVGNERREGQNDGAARLIVCDARDLNFSAIVTGQEIVGRIQHRMNIARIVREHILVE